MKKLYAILSILILSTSAFADGFKINVKLTGCTDSVCYLANYYGDKQYLQDTATVSAKGEMTFQGTKNLPKGIYIVVGATKVRYFDFIINNEQTMSITGDLDKIDQSLSAPGSKENTLFFNYIRFLSDQRKSSEPLANTYKASTDEAQKKKIEADLKKVDEDVKNYKKQLYQNNPNSFVTSFLKMMETPEIPEAPIRADGTKDSSFAYYYYRDHYWDNINLQDDGLIRTPTFHGKLKNYFAQVLPQFPDTLSVEADKLIAQAKGTEEVFKYLIFFVTNYAETSKVMGMDAAFVHMVETYYMTKQCYWVDEDDLLKITERAKLLKPILLGKVAPEIALTDSLGKIKVLSKVPNKYTIVCFWDPDCGHCKKEVPALKNTYLDLRKKGMDIEVYAVGATIEDDKWRKFIRENNLNWINVMDAVGARSRYDIYSTPVIYLLNKDKKIIAKRIGHENIEEIIKRTESGMKLIVTQKENEEDDH